MGRSALPSLDSVVGSGLGTASWDLGADPCVSLVEVSSSSCLESCLSPAGAAVMQDHKLSVSETAEVCFCPGARGTQDENARRIDVG